MIYMLEPHAKTKIYMRYFNFESSLKLRWRQVRDFHGSQIPVTTGEFELRTFYTKGGCPAHQDKRHDM